MASAFDINVIEDESIENMIYNGIEAGFLFAIRFTAYRGTQLSCMESFEVYLDGEKIEDRDIRFCLNKKEFLLDGLKDLAQEYWFILENAIIKVWNGKALKGEHQIEVKYTYRIPYTGYFGSYLIQEGIGKKRVTL